MATHFSYTSIIKPPSSPHLLHSSKSLYFSPTFITLQRTTKTSKSRIMRRILPLPRISSNIINAPSSDDDDDDDSYYAMWKRAMERKRREIDFLVIVEKSSSDEEEEETENEEVVKKKSEEFQKILQVPKEERDRVQQMQVVDRASAAIAAARALIKGNPPTKRSLPVVDRKISGGSGITSLYGVKSTTSVTGTPGPDFCSWVPPPADNYSKRGDTHVQKFPKKSENKPIVLEKEKSSGIFMLPFQSQVKKNLPPFQSFKDLQEAEASKTIAEAPPSKEEIDVQFSTHAEEAFHALRSMEENPSHGINPDGSRWWEETGIETRSDGVVCHWTLNRGVSADGAVEWEEKYWEEVADESDYKELGSEKSGRDASGNIWHEYWKEAMWQEGGLLNMEKTADKWGKNGKGDEWQEQWWEWYDASGKTDKWAHKWCSINPNTQLDPGHAHAWHERWGEKYDGLGGSTKYTDKWAERFEGDAWVKWGDKWDENFDPYSHGVKQGETWWEGKYGERWNRTWGEQHNGSGWVHKYGKSSSGEHWDTHVQEDTWHERFPHYGFTHCFQNSVQLREVPKPSDF